jgi:hypothetical protein
MVTRELENSVPALADWRQTANGAQLSRLPGIGEGRVDLDGHRQITCSGECSVSFPRRLRPESRLPFHRERRLRGSGRHCQTHPEQ